MIGKKRFKNTVDDDNNNNLNEMNEINERDYKIRIIDRLG